MKIPMFLRWKDDTCFSCVFPIPLMRDFSNLKYRVTLMCVCKYLYFYLDIVPALYKQIKRVRFCLQNVQSPKTEWKDSLARPPIEWVDIIASTIMFCATAS